MNLLGIDIGGSGVKGAPVDLGTGRLAAERVRIPTPSPAHPPELAKAVAELAATFAWHGPIGCAFPARVKHGVPETASNIPRDWIGTDAEALFAGATGCPVVVLNDADAAGVAELAYGAARGHEGLVLMLTFGTGIGSALFIEGRLVPNTEFGHVEIFGQKAEWYAADRIRKEQDLGWPAYAERVQRYLSHMQFVLAPDLIVVGGGLSRPKKWEKLRPHLNLSCEVVPAQLENEAGIVGAAYAARAAQLPRMSRSTSQ